MGEEDDLLGLAPEGVWLQEIPAEAVGSLAGWKGDIWVVETDAALVLLDPGQALLAVYPNSGPRTERHGVWRPYVRAGEQPTISEPWRWRERLEPDPKDPWGPETVERDAGVVAAVRKVDF